MITFPLLERFTSVRMGLHRLTKHHCQPLRLGAKHLILVRVVSRRPECSMGELGELLDIDMPALSRMINSLVRSRWLCRHAHPKDGRRWVICVGSKAKSRAEELDALVVKIGAIFASALTDREKETLVSLLTKVDESLIKWNEQRLNT
jgi:DNA-binding MarR family transcriptional regulator